MTACVGVASNHEPESHLHRGLELLAATFGPCEQSTVYTSAAIDDAQDSSIYFNLVVKFRTALSWSSLRDALRSIEAQCGRRRDDPVAVSLDLDRLVLFGKDGATLSDELAPARLAGLPHVLVPLAELLPDWVHPATGATLGAFIKEQQPRTDLLHAVGTAVTRRSDR